MRYGYFDDENLEYVIERPDIPVSWTNYRQNGIPLDRPGHYVYIRDDETGDYWTISWQPVGRDLSHASYQIRHGLSYSRFFCETEGIQSEQLVFIPIDDDVEFWDVHLKNISDRPRHLSVFSYVEFSFHHIEIDNQNLQMSLYASGMISSMNPGHFIT
jgi:N,N'-diacetylchitobiose phosphorylase